MFMRFKKILLGACLFAAVAFAMADDTKPLALAETPAAVQKTIAAQIGDGKLEEIDRNQDAGELEFDVSFTTKAGDERNFTVAEDGTLVSVEVALADTPAAVQKTIRAQANGWELDSIDKNVADAEVSFDVEVSKDGREKSFTVAADGMLCCLSVALTEIPALVQATIKNQITDGTVESIAENFDPDGNSFDVEAVTKAGGKKSFSVAPDGKMLSEEVTLEQVPPPARKTIREKIGGGKILRIDRSLLEKKENVLPYAVEGRKDGKPFDFSVGPHGRFLGMDE
jgi:uncharacterized membrane protein YkoI